MAKIITCFLLMAVLSIDTYGQSNKKNESEKLLKMNTEKLTNPTVKKAIEALSLNDKATWFSLFTNDAIFTDDGRKLDFRHFFDNAFSHKEKFLTIDKVENDGKDIYGVFFAGQWGNLNVFFKFHLNPEGKINRLDIGQH